MAATITKGKTFSTNEEVTAAKLHQLVDSATIANIDESEIVLFASGSQGDVVYRGATGWTRLGAGTDGEFLKTQGAGANPIWGTPTGGSLLQVVNTQTSAVATGATVIPYDDTIPQSSEGDEYMTLAITPADASNALKIDVVVNGSSTDSGKSWCAALYQDSTANALNAMYLNPEDNGMDTLSFSYYMAAGTASATTFKVRAGCAGAGTFTLNGQGGARRFGGAAYSSITITEIQA